MGRIDNFFNRYGHPDGKADVEQIRDDLGSAGRKAADFLGGLAAKVIDYIPGVSAQKARLARQEEEDRARARAEAAKLLGDFNKEQRVEKK